MASNEEDWEYADDDEEGDYEWEYEDEEEEAPAPAPPPAKEPVKEAAPVKTEEAPRRRERPKIEAEPDPEPPRSERLGRSDRNDILEQMKKLQEGFQLEVEEDEEDDISYSLSEDDDEDEAPPKPKKAVKLEDLDLDDLDDLELLDPFGDEPVPKKKDPPTNGHKNGDDKKHKKHKKKSKSEQEDHDKKIHVRSKDPRKIARQFEKGSGSSEKPRRRPPASSGPVTRPQQGGVKKPPAVEVNKICKVCGKEPYLVERLVAEKSWWCKPCFRCVECSKLLTLDTYASHQGVIYCKAHHKELFMPKAVEKDSMEELMRKKKNVDFSVYENGGSAEAVERHERQQKRMETIVRESRPVESSPGVVKSQVDNQKWDGLEDLDVGSKFLMFEKQEEKQSSDRYGIMEKLKRLQAGEDVSDLLEELNDEIGIDDIEEEEDPEDYGLTEVQKKAVHAEKLFSEKTKKEKMMESRAKELKHLRERLMAGTRDSVMDSFDELNHRKIKKTEVDVRSTTAKKFMQMFDKGEVPEDMRASDRITLEKNAELQMMRTKKRGERDYFKKLENGEVAEDGPKEPKLLVGKLKVDEQEEHGAEDPDTATLSKKFSFFEKGADGKKKSETDPATSERLHAVKECKASSVLNKFKQMEERAANGEDEYARNRPAVKRFTPPRKLNSDSESGSEYSDSEYSDSDYSDSEYSSDESYEGGEDKEYLRAVKDAARAKALRAKFEEWEAAVGEDGGYINLVDENGCALETASKLKNRFEKLAVEPEAPQVRPNPRKFQVKRFKPKEAYEHQMDS